MGKIVVTIWVLLGFASTIFNVEAKSAYFGSEHIEAIYNEIPKNVSGGVVDSIGSFALRVVTQGYTIEDLGVKIDNLEFDSPQIKRFIERKTLELLLAQTPREVMNVLMHCKCQLIYNGDFYSDNSLWSIGEAVEVLGDFTNFSYRTDDSIIYVDVSNKKNRLEIIFPANIQTVTDKNKMELELELESLLNSPFDVDIYKQPTINRKLNQIDGVYINSQNFFYNEAINDVTYFKAKGRGYEPIFGAEYVVESFTNIFHIANDNTARIDLNIKQWLYGNHTNEFKVSLDKIIAYCRTYGLDVYVGIENQAGNILESSILLENKKMKYVHILHVKCDMAQLFNASKSENGAHSEMLVNLYSYIPTDNIEELFSDDSYTKRDNKFDILNR